MTDERLAEIEQRRDSMILTYHSNPNSSHAYETGQAIDAINELIVEVRRLRAEARERNEAVELRPADKWPADRDYFS